MSSSSPGIPMAHGAGAPSQMACFHSKPVMFGSAAPWTTRVWGRTQLSTAALHYGQHCNVGWHGYAPSLRCNPHPNPGSMLFTTQGMEPVSGFSLGKGHPQGIELMSEATIVTLPGDKPCGAGCCVPLPPAPPPQAHSEERACAPVPAVVNEAVETWCRGRLSLASPLQLIPLMRGSGSREQ